MGVLLGHPGPPCSSRAKQRSYKQANVITAVGMKELLGSSRPEDVFIVCSESVPDNQKIADYVPAQIVIG